MIRYLGKTERDRIRPLYEEVFDDSAAFLNYYIGTYILQDTRCLVCEEYGEIVSMISVHEKTWCLREHHKQCSVWYLYAVATKERFRHQGNIRHLMDSVIADAKHAGAAYIYLIPENPAVYENMGFHLVADREVMNGSGRHAVSADTLCVFAANDFKWPESDACNKLEAIYGAGCDIYEILSELYDRYCIQNELDIYLKKDARYFKEQAGRARSESGDIYVVFDHDSICFAVTAIFKQGECKAAEYIGTAAAKTETEMYDNLTRLTCLLGADRWTYETHPVMIYACGAETTGEVSDAKYYHFKYGQMDEV